MTPKEKALELVERFTFRCTECDYEWKAKQCAIIAIDELIEYSSQIEPYLGVEWFRKVKQELEQL